MDLEIRGRAAIDAIAFLCWERASFITGVSLNVDGGRLKSPW